MNLEALGITNSGPHSLGVDRTNFKDKHFAMMLDVGNVPGIKASGESSQNGQEIRVSANKLSQPGLESRKPRILNHAILSDVIYEIRAGNVAKLD